MSYAYNKEFRVFEVPGEPKGKGRPRATVFGKHARVYTPQETAVYENHVAQCYLAKYASATPFEGAVHVSVEAYFAYPKSAHWPINARHNGELRPEWVDAEHVKKPDADNVLKAILDGLNKANAWKDDSQVSFVCVKKEYAEVPRVVITLEGDL